MDRKALVYMPRSCYNRIIKHIYANPRYECGGFLIGNRVDLEDTFVFSIREIYYEPLIGTMSSFAIDLDYTINAQNFTDSWQEKNRCDDYLVGTYHSHGMFDAFHSSTDDIYAKKFNLMMICSPTTRRIEVWFWSLGKACWYECELNVYDDDEIKPKTAETKIYSEDGLLRSGSECFITKTFYKSKKVVRKGKKLLVVGCGTLGNLLAEQIVDSNLSAEITFLDLDVYEKANLPRSPMIGSKDVGRPKAFALAEAVARGSASLYPVTGIVADVRMLSLDFFEKFDAVVTPLDNLECRYFVSYCTSVLRRHFINLGTSYMGINGKPSFSGDVFYKPARSRVCLDCFYPLYKSNEANLRKRISCSGEVDESVMPQVISSSMLVASVAFTFVKKALAYDNSGFSTGCNITDVVSSDEFFDKYEIRESMCCSFRTLHSFGHIKTIHISPKTRQKTLYRLIKNAFKDEEDGRYEIDMMESNLSHIKYRRENPIHSVLLDPECPGRMYHLIGKEYFPSDHVYAIRSGEDIRYLRIKIHQGDKK